MNQIRSNMNSPWMSLVILLGLTIACAIGVSIVVVLVELLLGGGFETILNDNIEQSLQIDFKNNPFYSYLSVIASSFGTFLLPAWLLQKIEPYNTYFPNGKKKLSLFLLLGTLFLFAFMPVMDFIGDMNLKMSLPESMQAIETWMKVQEDKMADLTKSMVMVDSWGLLFANLLAIAVMPAIAEEYYFRGALMNIVQRATKNPHVSIWVTAIIFSAIHIQFFGFFPRMILGAFFGYMLLWSKNIWVPIIGHFVNNGTVAIIAFYYTKQGKTYEDLQASGGYTIIVYLASLIISGLIGYYFYKKSKEIYSVNGKGLDKD